MTSAEDHFVLQMENGLLEGFKTGLVKGFCDLVGADTQVEKVDEFTVKVTTVEPFRPLHFVLGLAHEAGEDGADVVPEQPDVGASQDSALHEVAAGDRARTPRAGQAVNGGCGADDLW